MPGSRVNYILRSELKQKKFGNVSQRLLCDMKADVASELPSKSVAFQFDDESGRLCSAACQLVGVSNAEQLFPSSSRPDYTDYVTSELEPIARRRVDNVIECRVHGAVGMGLRCYSGTTKQHGWALKILSQRLCENFFKRVF